VLEIAFVLHKKVLALHACIYKPFNGECMLLKPEMWNQKQSCSELGCLLWTWTLLHAKALRLAAYAYVQIPASESEYYLRPGMGVHTEKISILKSYYFKPQSQKKSGLA